MRKLSLLTLLTLFLFVGCNDDSESGFYSKIKGKKYVQVDGRAFVILKGDVIKDGIFEIGECGKVGFEHKITNIYQTESSATITTVTEDNDGTVYWVFEEYNDRLRLFIDNGYVFLERSDICID